MKKYKTFLYKVVIFLVFFGITHIATALAGEPEKGLDLATYRVGPEDVLKISVWKDESLTAEEVVRPDGKISFPLVGDLEAEGKTVEEIKEVIRAKLEPLVSEPAVTVSIIKVNSFKIYVVGKVAKPGEYLVGHYPDVMQALSMAGGVTPFAAENQIEILRRKKNSTEVFSFRYGDVRKGRNLQQNIVLMPGDEVVVP